jgi:predicted O-methyltransferase YrrM
VTVDTDATRTELAGGHLASVGLADMVELRTEDAGRTLAESADAAWDFIFLDAERPFYAGYLPDLVRVLAPPRRGGGGGGRAPPLSATAAAIVSSTPARFVITS